jgi:hypothetical protein
MSTREISSDTFSRQIFSAYSLALAIGARNAFDLNLNRLNDVHAVLGVLSHAPYELALLWDLPDIVAIYEVDAAPTSRDIASFLGCLGDAEARPAFDFSRATGP